MIKRIFNRKRINGPVLYFLIAGGIFGFLLVFMLPPMQGPDEPNHFLRAYQISTGGLVSGYVNAYGERGIASKPSRSIGGVEPTSIVKLTRLGYGDLPPGDTQVKINHKEYQAMADIKNSNTKIAVSFPNTAVYSPVAYIPSVLGIEVGRIFDVSPLVLMYLARISDLLFGLIFIGLAIYLMPFGKYIFAILALLPMTLAQLAIITADTATYAFCFLAIALIFRFAYQAKDISKREIAYLLIVLSLLSLTKPALFPVSLLSFALLRNKNIDKLKAKLIAWVSLVLSLLCTLSWNTYIKQMASFGYKISYPGSNYNLQLSYIIHHPIFYLGVLYNSLFTSHFDGVPISFIGNLGWLDTPLPLMAIIVGFVIIGLAIYFSSQYEHLELPKWLRGLAFLGAFGIIIVTLTSQYLFSMPPKSTIIAGIQGRYFLPAALLIAIGFLAGKNKPQTKKLIVMSQRCLYASVVILAVTVVTVALRYYHLGSLTKHII